MKVAPNVRPVIVVLALSLGALGFAQNDVEAARKAIEAQTARFTNGFRARNLKAIDALMSSDCVTETAKGKMLSRAEELDSLKQLFAAIQKVSVAQSKITSAKLVKGVAIVHSENLVKATMRLPDGKSRQLVSRTKSLEQWTLKNGVWLLHYARELPGGKTTLDGKVVAED